MKGAIARHLVVFRLFSLLDGFRRLGTTAAMADYQATSVLLTVLGCYCSPKKTWICCSLGSLSTRGRSLPVRSSLCTHAPVWASSDTLDERLFQYEAGSSLTFSFINIVPPAKSQRSFEPSRRQCGGETCLTQQSWKPVVVDRRRDESPHSCCTDNVGKKNTFLVDVSVATVVVL